MSTISLEGVKAAVLVDSDRGASISHFGRTLAADDNVLARYDWRTPLPARSGPGYGDTTKDWLSEYRGGWQLLTPNAGEECIVDGVLHPCHGEVSRAGWVVVETTATRATMWTGTHSALSVTRTIEIVESGVRVCTTLANETSVPAPAILVEHIAFAGGDDARVVAAEGSQWRPLTGEAPGGVDVAWPDSRLSSRPAVGKERVDSLVGGSEGWIELHRPSLDRGVRITWDAARLPFLWHWEERGSARFPWFGRADIIGLEPSSSSSSDGLAAAMARGEAWTVEPGGTISTSVVAQLIQCRRNDRG